MIDMLDELTMKLPFLETIEVLRVNKFWLFKPNELCLILFVTKSILAQMKHSYLLT